MQANNGHPQERNWYIQVDGQAYGPFDDKTLWAFMCEGRVTALSLISQSANCLLYTSPSPRDATLSRMPSSA